MSNGEAPASDGGTPITARMWDGTTLQFPAGTPQEAVDRAARNYVMEHPPPRQRSIGEDVLRQTGLGARAIMRGAMQLPNFAGDVINATVNLPIQGINWGLRQAYGPSISSLITGQSSAPQIPELGRMSDVVNRGIDAITPTPETPTERVVGRVGEDLTSLLSGQGVVRSAIRGAQAVPTVARRVADAFIASPGTQAVATTGGALGGGVARELAPDSPIADIAGTATGLLAGTGGALAARGGAKLLAPLTTAGRERIVGQGLLDISRDPRTLLSRLTTGNREIVPGSLRTTAEVADDPALMALERTVRSQGPGEASDFALRDAQRNAARRAALELAPPVAASEAGDVVRGGLDAARQRAAAEVHRLYNVVPEDAGRFQGSDLFTRAMPDIMELYGRATGGIPAELRPIIDRMSNAGTMTYGDLRAMAREMGDIAGRARVAGDGTLANAAGGIRTVIDDMMGDAAAGGLNAQQLAAHHAALAARRRMGRLYDEGAVGRAIETNQFGRPVMPAENIPGTLTAGPTAARQLEEALANNPQSLAALRGSFVRNMQDSIQAPGSVDAAGALTDSAARFHGFIRDNAEVIRVLFGPQGERRLQTIAQDFASRQAVDSVGRAIGSNTVQNLSTANVVSAMLGGVITPQQLQTNPLFRPLGVLYRWSGSETALRELLAQATLDPMLAATLVQRATPNAVARAAAMINQSLARRIGGAAATAGRPALPAALPAIERTTTERPGGF